MINLKKFSTVLMSAGVLLGVLAAPVVGHADTKDSTVTASVSQDPNHGSLSLKQVPEFTFQTHIVNDGKAAGTADKDLIVDDETASASGWNLSAQLNSFSSDKENSALSPSGAYMGLLPTLDKGSNVSNSKVGAEPVVRNDGPTLSAGAKDATNIASAENAEQHKNADGTADGIGEGIGQWNIAFNPTLNATFPMVATSYSTTITWTLTSGPTSDVAATPTK
ncbi:hypothetical protein IWT5_01236 [Secundilactobacillus silagincola]|uniref:WxL domain-containing protein n=1 Tax=Secundilactobacillus silagincola TaxID=1714681 RepID=A0A1Z5J207_9LACO|nr:WxL domain-containing protein [Secundilactobacillus silagincola]GAX08084.1 hypothetical protein IWT5_01236 [Secundilactobacillus silagincola]